MSAHRTDKDYVAGELGYIYPALGEPVPPGGAKVLLLTDGGVCISGTWDEKHRNLAWSPMPRRGDYTYPTADGRTKPASAGMLLLTQGGICVFGAWTNDGRYLAWTRLPTRDQVKDGAITATRSRRRWSMAA